MNATWLHVIADRAGIIGAVAAGAVTVAVVAAASRQIRPDRLLAWAAAAIATGVSGTGMWRVADKALHLDGPLRAVLFGFAEIALLSSAIRARRHHATHGRGGPDAAGVWVIAVAAGTVSAMESTSVPEVAVRLAAPVLAAWLWHRGLDESGGRAKPVDAVTMRLTVRRVLVALRLADPGTVGLAEVARARLLDRVVVAAIHLDTATGRARARAARRLQRESRVARAHLDPPGVAYIRNTLAAVYDVEAGTSRAALTDLRPWSGTRTEAAVSPDDLAAVSARTAATTSDAPVRPGRGDAELMDLLAGVPREPDGTVPVRRAVAALRIGTPRAYRLLGQAGLLASKANPTEPDPEPAPEVDGPTRPINGSSAPAFTNPQEQSL